jgi:hypothetical protein
MVNKTKLASLISEKNLNNCSSMRLEKIAISNIKLLDCGVSGKNEKLYGIKRHLKVQLERLNLSIEDNGWVFPFVMAELPNKELWLIDGYARLKKEKKKNKYACLAKKYDSLIIQAKDLNHVKELYLQCQSIHGSVCYPDFIALDSKHGYSRYETGLRAPNFDLDLMTREQIAKLCLESKYQIL